MLVLHLTKAFLLPEHILKLQKPALKLEQSMADSQLMTPVPYKRASLL